MENGQHVFNFTCLIRADATVVEATMNCFGLGIIDIDQEYVDEYLSSYKDNGPPVWEKNNTLNSLSLSGGSYSFTRF